MRKQPEKIGVGQLTLQIVFPSEQTSDAAEETQDNGLETSSAVPELKSKAERKRKWYSLYDKVYAFANLWEAWLKVKENHGAAGIDRMTVKRFDEDAYARIEHDFKPTCRTELTGPQLRYVGYSYPRVVEENDR